MGALEHFGLSEKEARVYLACLELGDSLASDIAIKSSLPRTLVYDIGERLITFGLFSYVIKNNRKYFRAAEPREFSRILEEKQSSIKDVLRSLQELQKSKGEKRPKVEVYEGKEGMKTVMDDILRSGVKEFRAYGSSRSSFEVIPAFMEEWHKKRIQKKVVMKILYNNTKEAREKVEHRPDSLKLTRYRFMPVTVESPTATLIYGNKVVLQSWTKEPFAVMIENKEMAENQQRYFEELWKNARE